MRSPSPVLDRRKVIEPVPPFRPSPPPSTPPGVAGPSRRTPYYLPDDTLPPTPPPGTPKYPPARRIKKKGRYPPPAPDQYTFEPPRVERGPPCSPPAPFAPPEEFDIGGYADAFREVLQANLQVPRELYPPPEHVRARQPEQQEIQAQRDFERLAQTRGNLFDTSPPRHDFWPADEGDDLQDFSVCPGARGPVPGTEDYADDEFQRIATRGEEYYQGGVLDISPPPGVTPQDYYPDIEEAADRLSRSLEAYEFPPSPPSPCAPCGSGDVSRTPRREPSPQRAPSARRPQATRPTRATGAIPKIRPPVRESRSSLLRKEKLAAEKEAQMKKERAAKAAADKRRRQQMQVKDDLRRPVAERPAGAEAREARQQGDLCLPGERIRPVDYRPAGGTGSAPQWSAERARPQLEYQPALARRQLFGGPESSIRPRGRSEHDDAARMVKRKKGKRGPDDLRGVYLPCNDLPAPLAQSPEFLEELQQHEVDFPGYRHRVQVGGQMRPVRRRSATAVDVMEHIGEEEEPAPPCAICGAGRDAVIEEESMRTPQAARTTVLTALGQLEQAALGQPRTEEEEQEEFERLEREMGVEPPGGRRFRSPGQMEGLETYSPPRPQPTFGGAPCHQPGRPFPLADTSMEAPPGLLYLDEGDRSPQLLPRAVVSRRVREHVTSTARPLYDPGLRGDVLPRDSRRVARGPCAGMQSVREEEPLIPSLVGQEPPVEDRRQRRRDPRERRRRRADEDDPTTRYIRNLEERFDLPLDSPEPPLDEPAPQGLPRPLSPCGYGYEPRPPRHVVPPVHFTPPRQIYAPPQDLPIHPDLVDLAQYEQPWEVPEVADLTQEEMGEELFYTPPRYPETDLMEQNREALQQWQPPDLAWAPHTTPPSGGRVVCGTYTPPGSPDYGLLDAAALEGLDNSMIMTPPQDGPTQQELDEFLGRTPPSQKREALEEMRQRASAARGRAGIRPQPMYFGGYGETPQRPIPRWYGRCGAQNVIPEAHEAFSPPTPGTPPPQLPEMDEFVQLEREAEEEAERRRRERPRVGADFVELQKRALIEEMAEQSDRLLALSPDQRAFEQIERQVEEEEQRQRTSGCRQRQREYEEIRRRTELDEVTAEAERMEMEFARPPSPRMQRKRARRAPSPSRTPPPRTPQTPPGMPSPDAPCGTCGAAPDPFLEQFGDGFVGDELDNIMPEAYQSPEPLSRSWEERLPQHVPDLQVDEGDLWMQQVAGQLDRTQMLETTPPSFESPGFMHYDEAAEFRPDQPDENLRDISPPCLASPEFDPLRPYIPDIPILDLHREEEEMQMQQLLLGHSYEDEHFFDMPTPELVSPPLTPMTRFQQEMEERLARQEQREREEAVREGYFQREVAECRQMFAPSPTPLSPGPGEEFYDAVNEHQVPVEFSFGQRAPCAVQDTIRARDVLVQLPRRSRPPALEPIIESRVRVVSPEPRRPPPRPKAAPARPRPQTAPQGAPCGGGAVRRPPAASRQRGPQLQDVDEVLRAGDQQAPAGPCPAAAPTVTPAEAQRRARERVRQRKQQGDGPPRGRPAPREQSPPPSPPLQPFTAFIPPQVQMRMPRQPAPPPPQQDRRGGGCPGAGSSRLEESGSNVSQAVPLSRVQDASPRPGSGGAGSSRDSPQQGARRVTRKTTSVKKIVTRKN